MTTSTPATPQEDTSEGPLTEEEALDQALENSMDASDAPAITQPGDNGDPVPSSGFPEDTNDKA